MQVLRLNEVIAKTGRSRASIYADIERGSFPAPIKLGPRAIGFLSDEIDGWISERVAERDQRDAA
jgi:prophage regulatory protein